MFFDDNLDNYDFSFNDSFTRLFFKSSHNVNISLEFILPNDILRNKTEFELKDSNEKNGNQIQEKNAENKEYNFFNNSYSISNFEINKIISNKIIYKT